MLRHSGQRAAMSERPRCNGCAYLKLLLPVTSYGCHLSLCMDPDKPVKHGARGEYVIQADGLIPPTQVTPPVWCRGKQAPHPSASRTPSLQGEVYEKKGEPTPWEKQTEI